MVDPRAILHHSRRALLGGSLILILGLVLLWGALQWAILHDVDRYRPELVGLVSQATGVRAEIGALRSAGFHWRPTLIIEGVRLYDPQGHPGLRLDRIEAQLSLTGFLLGRIDLDRLLIVGPRFELRRSADGRLSLSGIPLPAPGSGPSPFLDWLFHQGDIRVVGAVFQWHDEALGTPPLRLDAVDFHLHNRGSHHRVEALFSPPSVLARPMRVSGDLVGGDTSGFEDWRGRVNLDFERLDLAALRPWLHDLIGVESGVGQGRLSFEVAPRRRWGLRARIDFHGLKGRLKAGLKPLEIKHLEGELFYGQEGDAREWRIQHLQMAGGVLDTGVGHLDGRLRLAPSGGLLELSQLPLGAIDRGMENWPLTAEQRSTWQRLHPSGTLRGLHASWDGSLENPDDYRVRADFERLSLTLPSGLPEIRNFTGHFEGNPNGGALRGNGQGMTLDEPHWFATALALDSYSLDVGWGGEGSQVRLDLHHLQLDNRDLGGELSGWINFDGGVPGASRIEGTLQRVRPDALWRYLPLSVAGDVRHWLQTSLAGPEIGPTHFVVDGDLRQFPFTGSSPGTFTLDAPLTQTHLRFDPGWPAIEDIHGHLAIRNAHLEVRADHGTIAGTAISEASAIVSDLLASDPHLVMHGASAGSVEQGLDFIAHSPLDRLLHHATRGWQGHGSGELTLGLDVPLDHVDDTQVVGDYLFKGASLDDGAGGVPPLNDVKGHLRFTERVVSSEGLTATVLGGGADLGLSTDPQGGVHLDAKGQVDLTGLRKIYRATILDDVSGKSLWQGHFTFTEGTPIVDLVTQGLYLNEPVQAHLQNLPDGTLDLALKGHTSRAALHQRYPSPLLRALDSGLDWEGHLHIGHDRTDFGLSGQAKVLDQPAHLTLQARGAEGAWQADLHGMAPVSALSRWGTAPGLDHLSGTTPWALHLDQSGDDTVAHLTASLAGWKSELPPPLAKPAATVMPLDLRIHSTPGGERVSATLSGLLGFEGERVPPQGGGGARWLHPVLRFGTHPRAAPETSGLAVIGLLSQADLDRWQGLFAEASSGQGSNQGSQSDWPVPTALDLDLDRVRWVGREWSQVRVQGERRNGQWSVAAHGPVAEGELSWSPGEPGQIRAHFAHFLIPGRVGKANDHSVVDPSQANHMLNLELVAERFSVGGDYSGRLHLNGAHENDGWHVNTLSLDGTGGLFEAEGHWRGGNATVLPRNQYTWHLKTGNLGQFMNDAGNPGLVARGEGEIRGQLGWPGNPEDFALASSEGQMSLDLRDGQFSKVQPGGLGRLISLFSLQTLPRRITLDFHDVFSEGFAFDTLNAEMTLKQGVLSTRDFVMKGPAARVALEGDVDLHHESSDLTAQVEPSVGGSVALATTVIGGPIAGVATYLVQKLLSNPLGQVLTYRYRIRGSWDDPQIESIPGG